MTTTAETVEEAPIVKLDMNWKYCDHGKPWVLMIANEAAGWSELVASLLAPALRNRYYPPLCLIFILAGLHNDYYIAARKIDPIPIGRGRLRALLREYENDHRPATDSQTPSIGPEEGASE